MPRRNQKPKKKQRKPHPHHAGAMGEKILIAWSRSWQIKQRRWGPWRKEFFYDLPFEECWRDFDSWLSVHNQAFDPRYDDMEEKKRIEGVILGEAEVPWKVEGR